MVEAKPSFRFRALVFFVIVAVHVLLFITQWHMAKEFGKEYLKKMELAKQSRGKK